MLREREDALGVQGNQALANISLPFTNVIMSGFQPFTVVQTKLTELSRTLLMGPSIATMLICGAILMVLFLFVETDRPRWRTSSLFKGYTLPDRISVLLRLVPGGAWVLSGKPLVGLFILTSVLLMWMPVVAWPSDVISVVYLEESMFKNYIISLVAVAVWFVVWGFTKEREV